MAQEVKPAVEPQAPIEPTKIPVVDAAVEEPKAPSKAKAPKTTVTLSAASVAHYGLDSDQVELVERGEAESVIKAGGQEYVVGNEEIS